MSTSKRNSQLCPRCRKLISRSVSNCPHCGLRNPASLLKNSFLYAGVNDPNRMLTLLLGINIVMFVLSVLINPARSSFNFNPLHFLSPSNQSLLFLGSTGTIPVFQLHRWWTLVSANYLHGGLLHLVFNMLALRQLAPLVIQLFGLNRAVIIYCIGGAAGFLLSVLAGVSFTIGASAALCSLIGAVLYYGKSRGGIFGENLFSQVGGWALGIAVFGFVVPGINNWGHGGGMAAGALLAYLLGYNERKREEPGHRTLAITCLGITCCCLLWSLFNGAVFLLYRLS